jgi:hypothetical protein
MINNKKGPRVLSPPRFFVVDHIKSKGSLWGVPGAYQCAASMKSCVFHVVFNAILFIILGSFPA